MIDDTPNQRRNGQARTARNPKAAGRPRKNLPPELRVRKNGQERTARNPKAAGRIRYAITPDVLMYRAMRQSRYNAKHKDSYQCVYAYLTGEQASWLADYALLHRLRGYAPAIRHLIDRAMHE